MEIDLISKWFQTHPRGMTVIVILLVFNMVMKAVVDALTAVKTEADKPQPANQTAFDKFVFFMQMLALFFSKVAAYFAGFRSNL